MLCMKFKLCDIQSEFESLKVDYDSYKKSVMNAIAVNKRSLTAQMLGANKDKSRYLIYDKIGDILLLDFDKNIAIVSTDTSKYSEEDYYVCPRIINGYLSEGILVVTDILCFDLISKND